MNLQITPFSSRGSYMALIEKGPNSVNSGDIGKVPENGLYLKSLHGISAHAPAVARIFPTSNRQEIPFTYSVTPEKVTLQSEIGEVELSFNELGDIEISTKGRDLGIGFDFIPEPKSKFDHAIQTVADSILINSYKTLTKYTLDVTEGSFVLQRSSAYKDESLHENLVLVSPTEDGHCFVTLSEVKHYMSLDYNKAHPNFGKLKAVSDTFSAFAAKYHQNTPSDPNVEMTDQALYTIWSCIVGPQGNLPRESVWMSNTHFAGIWSWDQAYVALGLAGAYPKLAYDELMEPFDFQDEYGQLPGSFSDSTVRWNFSKPPVHALVLDYFSHKQALSRDQLLEIYEKLPKQVAYWLNFADLNHDGLPEYQHGNDSGYDNSTVFDKSEYITSPDLTAYLIRAYDVLSNIADRLGRESDVETWSKQAADLTKLFLDKLVVNGLPVARDGLTGEVVESGSQLPLSALAMGARLPSEVRKNILDLYHSEKYLTDYGIATERITSPKYSSHSYWRGPIWPSEMVNIYISLKLINENTFAKDLATRFTKAVEKSGFRENFDAVTGEGYDDTAHTWTAGAYLFFTNELFGMNQQTSRQDPMKKTTEKKQTII